MTNKFDLQEQMQQAEKEYGFEGGGQQQDTEWFNFEDGANKFRLLTPFAMYATHFTGGKYQYCVGKDKCPFCADGVNKSMRGLCFVLDRKDKKVKPADFPYTVLKQIQAHQVDPEWEFDEAPVPYDFTVNKKGSGKETEYSTIGSPRREPLPQEILDELAKQNSPEEIKENKRKKQLKALGLSDDEQEEENKEEINPDEIPM